MPSEIEIRIPANNILERKYVANYIFDDFLGIKTNIIIDEQIENYEIIFETKKVIILDAFFSFNVDNFTYLNISNLPKITWAKNQFLKELNIPILYGTSKMEFIGNSIVCGIDIFASVFFMLTRWEEHVCIVRDKYERFPGVESIAYKNNFLHRPIVNEYIEMLWNILVYIGYKEKRKYRRFELILTHDIDFIFNAFNPFRIIVGDIVKRKSLRLAFSRLPAFFRNYTDTYDFLMDVSESVGIKSHFYFMASDQRKDLHDTPFYLNTKKFRDIILKIRKRGHVIGFHPGYQTFENEGIWKEEREKLEKVLEGQVFEGRQHCLRMNIIKTLTIWDNQGMQLDSTLGYADVEGFRCGTGDLFPVFDFSHRKILNVSECPLILMDVSLKNYRNLTNEELALVLRQYIDVGKKYNMPITWLFHNSSFDIWKWKGLKEIYKETIQGCVNKSAK